MQTTPQQSPRYPIRDSGYFHLTEQGWERKDKHPFPAGRLETWRYEMEQPANDAKEQVRLVRIWTSSAISAEQRRVLRMRFGNAIEAGTGRHIMIDCSS